jgi:hypothetical protein
MVTIRNKDYKMLLSTALLGATKAYNEIEELLALYHNTIFSNTLTTIIQRLGKVINFIQSLSTIPDDNEMTIVNLDKDIEQEIIHCALLFISNIYLDSTTQAKQTVEKIRTILELFM